MEKCLLDILKYLDQLKEHFIENIDLKVRIWALVIIAVVAGFFWNKLRKTNFRKEINHIISNDLLYPLSFFLLSTSIEVVIKMLFFNGHFEHYYWIFIPLNLIIFVLLIRWYIQGTKKIKLFSIPLWPIAPLLILISLFYPNGFHLLYEFIPIVMTTIIYLTLRNYTENKNEMANETSTWVAYERALENVEKKIIVLNTDDYSHFSTPRGFRYFAEQLKAIHKQSTIKIIRKLVNTANPTTDEEYRNFYSSIKSLTNNSFGFDTIKEEIAASVKELNCLEDNVKKLTKMSSELNRKTSLELKRFFVVDVESADDLLGCNEVNCIVNSYTELTDELRVFYAIYTIHRLYQIEIYLIPKKELETKLHEKPDTTQLKIEDLSRVIIDNKHYEAKPTKKNLFSFEEVRQDNQQIINNIINDFSKAEYNLENLRIRKHATIS